MLELDPELEMLGQRIIGAAITVHRALGPGFLEPTYKRAMAVELGHLGLDCLVEHPVAVMYRGVMVGDGKIDLLVQGAVIVELKAVEALMPAHKAQIMSYLRATKLKLGLLINFNSTLLKSGIQRVIQSNP